MQGGGRKGVGRSTGVEIYRRPKCIYQVSQGEHLLTLRECGLHASVKVEAGEGMATSNESARPAGTRKDEARSTAGIGVRLRV